VRNEEREGPGTERAEGGCMTAALGTENAVQGPFSKSGNQAEGGGGGGDEKG